MTHSRHHIADTIFVLLLKFEKKAIVRHLCYFIAMSYTVAIHIHRLYKKRKIMYS